MRVLPDNLRNLLKEPIGQLVSEKELIKLLRKEKYIVSIGDIVTYTILKHKIEPKICIVDFKTRRGTCSTKIKELIKSFGKKSIILKNPPASISNDLWNVIEMAYENLENGSLRIEVEGEEDLASLAAIYLAPSYVTIIYGLPDKGVLVVKATSKNKKLVKEVLNKM